MLSPTSLLLAALPVVTTAPAQNAEDQRVAIPGELIVSVYTPNEVEDVTTIVSAWDLEQLAPTLQLEDVRALLQWQPRNRDDFRNVVHLEFNPASVDSDALAAQLRALPGVEWVAPNSAYRGDPRELVPNDPQYGQQYHHPLMQNDDAWDITLGDSSVIIGITDDGVDRTHDDLAPNIWVNVGETPGDGIDNDNNGYVDDVNGWDFVSQNNDPNPNNGNDHGTHCAGISAAKTNNGIGVAGVAGDSTIMPLQFYISGQAWTAANIAETFAYGADNGANILSTSYNMDGWAADPVVFAAFDYLYDNGVLHFNSAGNGNTLNPARQVFTQSMLVISTDSGDARSSFSNYGDGCDVCAPGSSVLSTVLNQGYGLKSGTSMAAPNAAGVAGLIWAHNPGWTRDQVAAQLFATADNIDAQNPGFEGNLGGGRVNSFRALTEVLDAPRLTSAEGLPMEGGTVVGELTSFDLRFDQILDPATVNGGSGVTLTYAGADDTFGTADDANIGMNVEEYLISSNRVRVSPMGPLPFAGQYRVTASGSVLANPFGTTFDGDGDGQAGGDWTRTFFACETIEIVVDNAESGADWSVVNQNLSTGEWTVPPVVPTGGGARNDPPTDFDMSGRCFVTQDGPGDTDVDGGPTRLISRAFDLSGTTDPYVSFAVWLGPTEDVIELHLSNDDGGSWNFVESIGATDGWEILTYRISDTVAPSAQFRVRWSLADLGTGSITEGGIDFIRIVQVDCDPSNIATSYCAANANSTGVPAEISVEGSPVVTDNDVTLIAESMPQVVFGYFLNSQTQGFVANPGGSAGNLCLGGSVGRYSGNVLNSGGTGSFQLQIDLTQTPQPTGAVSVMAGETWNFQAWFRDSVLGFATSNFTNGGSVVFV